jgi:CubicO group peptidase (beta-lactamase class C family)
VKTQKTFELVGTLLLLLGSLTACGVLEPDRFSSYIPDREESIVSSQAGEGDGNEGEIAIDQENASKDIEKYVEKIMSEDNLPGAAVAVVRGDVIVFAEGFGFRDVENGLPVTRETLFHIGSTNKSMTAMMIATLVDQGLFDWDTPVVDIYPDFELSSDEATQTVTIRHLLSMQSGIPDYAEDDFDTARASGEDVFEYVRDVPLLGQPGEEFSYSNISASLAGYLGVIAADDDYPDLYSGYEQLLRKQVLDPIGMSATVLRYSEVRKNPDYGKSYVIRRGKVVVAEREDFDGDPLAPSGVLKANVMDMAAYIGTQLNRGQAPNGVRVVSEKNLMETWKPGLENYAMGWDVSEYDGAKVISHEGAFDNYLSVVGFVPDLNVGFVILTNSEEAGERLIGDGPMFLIDLFNK